MLSLKPEIVAQLERVLSSVEMLLPKAIAPIDWATCPAANCRRHSFSGYLEPVKVTDTTTLDELLGVDEQKNIMISNTRQFLAGLPANNACDGVRTVPANHRWSRRCSTSSPRRGAFHPGGKRGSDLSVKNFHCGRKSAIPFYSAL